jgi:predicted DNA binding CopG/RHH family protein
VADLKKIAAKQGLGYHAYVRQVLTKHVAAIK